MYKKLFIGILQSSLIDIQYTLALKGYGIVYI